MIGDALQRGAMISKGNAVIRNGMDRYSQDVQWNRPASHCDGIETHCNGIDEQGIAVNCNGKGMNCIGNDWSRVAKQMRGWEKIRLAMA